MSPERAGWRRPLFLGLRLAVTVFVLVWLVRELGGLDTLAAQLLAVPAPVVVAVLVVNTLDRLLMTYKWLRLLRVRGEDLPLLQATRIYCAAMVWGMFLPATVGADAVRTLCVRREGVGGSDVVATILVERALGFLASLLLGLAGLLAIGYLEDLPPALEPAAWLATAILASGTAVLALSLDERTFGWLDRRVYAPLGRMPLVGAIRRIHESYRAFRHERRELRLFFGLSVAEQLAPAVGVWLLAWGLGSPPSPVYVAAAVAISYVVARTPISLGGIGVLEGMLVYLLVLGGMEGDRALAVSIAARILEVGSWLPWWAAYVAARGTPRPPRTPQA